MCRIKINLANGEIFFCREASNLVNGETRSCRKASNLAFGAPRVTDSNYLYCFAINN